MPDQFGDSHNPAVGLGSSYLMEEGNTEPTARPFKLIQLLPASAPLAVFLTSVLCSNSQPHHTPPPGWLLFHHHCQMGQIALGCHHA